MDASAAPHLVSTETTRLEQARETIQALHQRVERLERTIRLFLTGRKLSQPQRLELLELLSGLRTPHYDRKNPPGLTPTEVQLIARYRRMSAAKRSSLRTLIDLLSADRAPARTRKSGSRAATKAGGA